MVNREFMQRHRRKLVLFGVLLVIGVAVVSGALGDFVRGFFEGVEQAR